MRSIAEGPSLERLRKGWYRARVAAAGIPAKHVCFHLRGQRFGAGIDHVKETVELGPLTRVFRVDRCIAGVMSLRGDIIAVIDLARFLGLPDGPHGKRILIAQVDEGGRERTAGLLVDQLDEVRLLDDDQIQPAPPAIDPAAAAYLRGVVSLPEGPLGVLDLPRVISSERFRPYRRVA